jgi:hypothetical protein
MRGGAVLSALIVGSSSSSPPCLQTQAGAQQGTDETSSPWVSLKGFDLLTITSGQEGSFSYATLQGPNRWQVNPRISEILRCHLVRPTATVGIRRLPLALLVPLVQPVQTGF